MMRYMAAFGLLALLCVNATAQGKPRIAVLGALPPATTAQVADLAARKLNERFTAEVITPEQLADPARFNASTYQLLLIPHAQYMPANSLTNLTSYIKAKGRLLCLGGPPFTNMLYNTDGAWVSRQTLLDRLSSVGVLLDVASANVKTWSHASNDAKIRSDVEVTSSEHGPALHFTFADFTGWDNHAPAGFGRSPYPAGSDLMMFWAKGDAKTEAAVIEWKERDGSRWITAIPLTTQWKRYTLAPDDFRYWHDSSAPNRGGAGDHFQPANAWVLSMGLAQSHANIGPGPKQFWIADLQAGILGNVAAIADSPVLEGLSPWYKVIKTQTSYQPVERYLGATSAPGPGRLTVHRANGMVTAWSYASNAGATKGAVWGASTGSVDDIVRDATSMLRDWRALSAGPRTVYTQGAGAVPFSATLINGGSEAYHIISKLVIDGPTRQTSTASVTLPANAPTQYAVQPKSPLAVGAYTYTWTFTDRTTGTTDCISGAFTVGANTASPRATVTARNGDFLLNGKPWRPIGVNFWPLWVSGQDQPDYWSHWLTPDQYDAAQVEMDLARAQKLGINEMSIQFGNPEQAPSVQDFLTRCERHGIKANIYIGFGHPLSPDLPKLKELIAAANLRAHNAVFAYDIAWEPRVGGYNERKRFGPDWQHWIEVNYGSLQKAAADWGVDIPTENGAVTSPTDSMLANDGAWRKMVAAYRRFLDDSISWRYREVRNAIRAIDPVHLIGVRSGYGGNGNPWCDSVIPFDLVSGAKHLDFVSPEGYALAGDWKAFQGGGGYTTAYARWAGNGKPVFWAECGQSVYPGTNNAKIATQGQYITNTLRMVQNSGASGASAWWWPGGLRLDENSDFGVMNPDGTPRPAALVLGAYARNLAGKSTQLSGPSHSIAIDRDLDARGYSHLWTTGRDEFGAARAKGLVVRLCTSATGKTTADMDLLAVNGDPADGTNPLKYANAEINYARISRTSDGKAQLTVQVGNTGEAAWAYAKPVYSALQVKSGGTVLATIPITKAVARYADYTFAPFKVTAPEGQPITIRMVLCGRATSPLGYGEQRTIN